MIDAKRFQANDTALLIVMQQNLEHEHGKVGCSGLKSCCTSQWENAVFRREIPLVHCSWRGAIAIGLEHA